MGNIIYSNIMSNSNLNMSSIENMEKKLKMAIENAPMDFPKHFQAERAKFGHVQHRRTTTARHIKRSNKRIALNIYQQEIELVNFTKEKKKKEEEDEMKKYKDCVRYNPIDYHFTRGWIPLLEELDAKELKTGISKKDEFIHKNKDGIEPQLEDINSKLSCFSKNTSFWGNIVNVDNDEDVLE